MFAYTLYRSLTSNDKMNLVSILIFCSCLFSASLSSLAFLNACLTLFPIRMCLNLTTSLTNLRPFHTFPSSHPASFFFSSFLLSSLLLYMFFPPSIHYSLLSLCLPASPLPILSLRTSRRYVGRIKILLLRSIPELVVVVGVVVVEQLDRVEVEEEERWQGDDGG